MWELIGNQRIGDLSIVTLAMQINNSGCMAMTIVNSMQPTLVFVQGVKLENGKLVYAWEDEIDEGYASSYDADDVQFDDDDDDDDLKM